MTKKRHKTEEPKFISENNLSKAWAEAIIHVIDNTGTEISPLLISITGFDKTDVPSEDILVRHELDKLLLRKNFRSIENVAHTIFPQRIWMLANKDRHHFYEIYIKTFKRYQKMNKQDNQRGSYFERLIQYGRGVNNGNQLEWILSQYNNRNNVRRSMLQASIFDPERDHLPQAQLQFPCLQHVSFIPTDNGLVLNAFYATQQLFDKAYGNYLGLSRLGAFMAHEMNMTLHRVNITIGVAKLERINKTDAELTPLIDAMSRLCGRNFQCELLV